MAEQTLTTDETQKMTSEMRYYYRNREDKIEKVKARYNNNPEVIAKREEKERKRAEKGAEKLLEKEAKRIEKEKKTQEKQVLAEATKRKFKQKSENGLDAFLVGSS
jgi:hypothetical protein